MNVLLSNAIVNLNQIISAIAEAADVKRSSVTVIYLYISSINIKTIIPVTDGSDLTAFSSNYQSKLQNIADFKLISKNIVINGDTSTSSSTSIDLGLILGVSIPLIILRNYWLI